VLTDGADTESKIKHSDLLSRLWQRPVGLIIVGIGIVEPDSSTKDLTRDLNRD
jgi:hypothetical protein